MTSRRNQFHFTETIYLCLRSLRGPCIVTADFWANSPKGGDAKPPVYGDVSAYDSGVAGPNVSALRSRGSRASFRSDTSTDPIPRSAWPHSRCGGTASSCRALGQGRIAFVFLQ